MPEKKTTGVKFEDTMFAGFCGPPGSDALIWVLDDEEGKYKHTAESYKSRYRDVLIVDKE